MISRVRAICLRWVPERHRVRVLALAGILLVAGTGWLVFSPGPRQAPRRVFDQDTPVMVEQAPVHVGPLRKELSVSGSLRANQRVVLHVETQGIISKIHVQPGDMVKQGQVLVELDSSRLEAQMRDAEAKVAHARALYEKEHHLLSRNAGTKISYTEALQRLRMAEAQADLVRLDLERARIVAPFDGCVSLHDWAEGAMITPGADLMTLVDMQKVGVDFRVPEQHLGLLEVGGSIDVQTDRSDNAAGKAVIRAIDPFVDPVTHTVQVRAELGQPDASMRPGTFVRVVLPLHLVPRALMVPELAVQREGTEEYVVRVVEGRAFRTLVVTGLRKGGMVEIVDGLTQDDVIVTAGHQRVRDGQRVQPVEPREPAA